MNTPSPAALLRSYFVDLRMNNWSPRTIDRRSFSLGKFIQWCGDRGIDAVTEISGEAVQAYRRSLFHHRNVHTGKPLNASYSPRTFEDSF